MAENLRGLNSFLKKFKNYKNEYYFDEQIFNQLLSDAKIYLDEKNVNKRLIYYIPSYSYHSYKKDINHPQLNKIKSMKNKVREIVLKNGFEFIDGNFYLDKVEDRLNLYHYGYPTHFNSFGYKLVADQVATEF